MSLLLQLIIYYTDLINVKYLFCILHYEHNTSYLGQAIVKSRVDLSTHLMFFACCTMCATSTEQIIK